MKKISFEKGEYGELIDILEKRGVLADRAIAIQEEFKKLGDELKIKEHEMNRLQDKSLPIVKGIEEGLKLAEFNFISKIDKEDGCLVVYVSDQIEDFKEMLKERAKASEEKKVDETPAKEEVKA
jgi:hypothetical protein